MEREIYWQLQVLTPWCLLEITSKTIISLHTELCDLACNRWHLHRFYNMRQFAFKIYRLAFKMYTFCIATQETYGHWVLLAWHGKCLYMRIKIRHISLCSSKWSISIPYSENTSQNSKKIKNKNLQQKGRKLRTPTCPDIWHVANTDFAVFLCRCLNFCMCF